jgi:hypothetical protein
MTDPTHRPEHAARRKQESALGPEVLQFAAKVFNLAREGDTSTLAAYVDAGVPANLCNHKGDTLVMLAAYNGHPRTVAALLERGADPDRANDRGQTPLAGAVFRGEREVIGVLLNGGADPTAGTPSAIETARCSATTLCHSLRRALTSGACFDRREIIAAELEVGGADDRVDLAGAAEAHNRAVDGLVRQRPGDRDGAGAGVVAVGHRADPLDEAEVLRQTGSV